MKPAAAFLLLSLLRAGAVTDVKFADHPTSKDTSYPQIRALHAHNGRLYIGYGSNQDYYPAVFVAGYDPVQNVVRVEHSAASDSITTFRTIDGSLYVPHDDPIHYEDFRDYSYLGPDGVWRDAAPAGCFHVYDFAKAGDALYFCGSHDASEGGTSSGIIYRSRDNGASWSVAVTGYDTRHYWCYGLGDRLIFRGGILAANGTITSASHPDLANGQSLTIDGVPHVVFIESSTLKLYDGIATTTLATGITFFSWDGASLYIVAPNIQASGSRVKRASWLSAAGALWEPLPVELETNGNQTAFAVMNGVAYFGRFDGSLSAANLDGTPRTNPLATKSYAMPDSFGRSLTVSGSYLAIGSPDFSGAKAASGRMELFRQMGVFWGLGGPPSTVLSSAGDNFSGWYGKDAAWSGDLLAVMETGYDGTRRDRGSGARIHVLQANNAQTPQNWTSRAVLTLPYAHSVAIGPDFLAAATANFAGDQAAGKPGVTPYRITRSAQSVASLTAQTQLAPAVNSWGYKPSTRVAMQDDLIVAGFAGDPSRQGSKGMVSMWRRAAAGTSFTATPVQEIASSNPERFGYAVALDGLWLAVGAPREDTAASQAGAVYLYRRNDTQSNFTLTKTLLSPAATAEAQFGSALALRGDWLLAGAPGVTVGGTPRRGAVYIYNRSGNDWLPAGTMPMPSDSTGEFGIEVAITDTWFVAGSRLSAPGAFHNTAPLSLLKYPELVNGFGAWTVATGLNAPASSAEADPDGDGLSNLLEYAAGLNPLQPDAFAGNYSGAAPWFGLPSVSNAPGGGVTLTWAQRLGDSRLTVSVEASTDLNTWSPVTDIPETVFQDSTMIVKRLVWQQPAAPWNYFRLKVTYQSS